MRRPKDTPGGGPKEQVPAELLERCRRGEQQAWDELVEVTHREVYTLCLRILADPDDAAEATQDAYLKLWRGLAGFRGDALFSTWLYRVATNAALSVHRSRRRRRAHEGVLPDEALGSIPAAGTGTEEAAGARVELETVEAALARLPEHHRQVVVLRDVYGLSMEEIAERLKISETAAKVRVHRARKRLKEMLFPEGTAGG